MNKKYAIIFQMHKLEDSERAEERWVVLVLHVTKIRYKEHHPLSLLGSFARDAIVSLFVLHKWDLINTPSSFSD